jgi:prepilin-type N-terminal cleavage/methylation domain-containing protein
MIVRTNKGFTLLEVMVAIGILAIALISISSAQSSSIYYVTRTFKLTKASFLIYGVINDIEDYYQRKGFPGNNIAGKDCELPREFREDFECTYALTGMNLTAEMIAGLVQAGYDSFLSGISSGGWDSSKSQSSDRDENRDRSGSKGSQDLSGIDLSQIAMFAPLFGGNAEEIIAMCNINIAAIIQGITGLIQFLPQIIEKVSDQTRELTVKITWKESIYKKRDMQVSTFIVSLPEAEIERLRQLEEMQKYQQK